MHNAEAGSDEWSSAQFGLRAFAGSAAAFGASPSPAASGWRESFGELWCRLAIADPLRSADSLERPTRVPHVTADAKRQLSLAELELLSQLKDGKPTRHAALHVAAVALESSARIWQAAGPAAGECRLHLLRRLEQTLADTQRTIDAAELPMAVGALALTRAGRRMQHATEQLLDAAVDRADALAALEQAAVELASLTIRVAIAPRRRSSVSVRRARRSPVLRDRLDTLATEAGAAARRSRAEIVGERRDHAGLWLSHALAIARPAEAIALLLNPEADRCLQADALLCLRAHWLDLAATLWLLVEALDDRLQTATFAEPKRLEIAVRSRAGSALVASALHWRAAAFDHERAWERQRSSLHVLVDETCWALDSREEDAGVRSQQLALRRLARALVAIWSIDERLQGSGAQVSRPCR